LILDVELLQLLLGLHSPYLCRVIAWQGQTWKHYHCQPQLISVHPRSEKSGDQQIKLKTGNKFLCSIRFDSMNRNPAVAQSTNHK
jgi:hypothetical protein